MLAEKETLAPVCRVRSRLKMAVAADEALQQELLDAPGCIPLLTRAQVQGAVGAGAGGEAGGGGGGGGAGDGGDGTSATAPLPAAIRARACGDSVLVVLVRRSGRTRRFSRAFEHSIRRMIEGVDPGGAASRRTAASAAGVAWGGGCRMRLAVYDSDAGQTPAAVLALFAAAHAVIAPHGAGLANLIAARPGMHVLEFHPALPQHPSSGLPGLNLCMLHLARALGFAYSGAVMWPVEEAAQGHDDDEEWEGEHRYRSTSWAGHVPAIGSWIDAVKHTWCSPQSPMQTRR